MAFIGIVGAAKAGCRSSCTRSKSQADNGNYLSRTSRMKYVWGLRFMPQDNMTNYHLNLIAKASRPTQLLAGPQSNCQERGILLLFLASSWFSAFGKLKALKKSVLFTMLPNRLFFTTYFTHVQTSEKVRVQSATQPTRSGHTAHMSKPVITFVFKVLRNRLPRDILRTWPNLWKGSCSKCSATDYLGTYCTHGQTCDKVRVQSATQSTAVHYILYTCPNRPNLWKHSCSKCYATDYLGTYCAHVQTCDNVRVQSATQPTTSWRTVQMATPVIRFLFNVVRNPLFCATHFTHVQTCDNVRVQRATQSTAFRIFSLHSSYMSKPVKRFVFQVLRNRLFLAT